MIVNWDTGKRVSTYDYFTWQTQVASAGATEIVFRTDNMRSTKWPLQEAKKRFLNYIWPGPGLHRIPCRIGTDGDAEIGSIHMQDLPENFTRMRSVLPPDSERYTVTLRQTFHNTFKNSDQDLWREFANRIRARVIEDHAVEPIGLYERMALYAGAHMNFGVPNGPVSILWYTPYPLCMVSDPATSAKSWGGHGYKPGDRIKFLLDNQSVVWAKPTMDILMREFERMQR